jgi:ABC-2 type transport system permease protein
MSTIELSSVRSIANKDFNDAVRSWAFWGLSAFFLLLMAGAAGVITYIIEEPMTTQEFSFLLSQVTKLVIPLIALLLGWKAIAGERDSGSIKVLLSLPHSRMDAVLGKFLGRTAVLSVSLVVGFVLASVAVVWAVEPVSVTEYVGFLAMTVLYGMAYVSIAVALSSVTRSSTIAAGLMFGVFVLFYVVWNVIQTVLQILMRQGYIDGVEMPVGEVLDAGAGSSATIERLPNWALFIDTIDPGTAYQNALTVVSASGTGGIGTTFGYPQSAMFPDGMPFYLQDWFSFVILLAWIVVPLAVALVRFDRAEI